MTDIWKAPPAGEYRARLHCLREALPMTLLTFGALLLFCSGHFVSRTDNRFFKSGDVSELMVNWTWPVLTDSPPGPVRSGSDLNVIRRTARIDSDSSAVQRNHEVFLGQDLLAPLEFLKQPTYSVNGQIKQNYNFNQDVGNITNSLQHSGRKNRSRMIWELRDRLWQGSFQDTRKPSGSIFSKRTPSLAAASQRANIVRALRHQDIATSRFQTSPPFPLWQSGVPNPTSSVLHSPPTSLPKAPSSSTILKVLPSSPLFPSSSSQSSLGTVKSSSSSSFSSIALPSFSLPPIISGDRTNQSIPRPLSKRSVGQRNKLSKGSILITKSKVPSSINIGTHSRIFRNLYQDVNQHLRNRRHPPKTFDSLQQIGPKIFQKSQKQHGSILTTIGDENEILLPEKRQHFSSQSDLQAFKHESSDHRAKSVQLQMDTEPLHELKSPKDALYHEIKRDYSAGVNPHWQQKDEPFQNRKRQVVEIHKSTRAEVGVTGPWCRSSYDPHAVHHLLAVVCKGVVFGSIKPGVKLKIPDVDKL